jgi:MFS family permease
MPMWAAMAIVLCNMLGMRGSRMVASLLALDLGASQFLVGVIGALYSLVPMFLGLYAGKLIDRVGVRKPIIAGSLGLTAGLLLPGVSPTLAMLILSASAIGAAHIFYNVSIQNLIGQLSHDEDRARNFSNFAMMMSLSGFIGPIAAGALIDAVGHAPAYLLLAAAPLAGGVLMMTLGKVPAPAPLSASGAAVKKNPGEPARHGFGLFAYSSLRRIIIVSAILLTGIDLLTFYMPIYGHSIGLSATRIGMILGAFSAAAFVVRVWMPDIVRRVGENNMLTFALGLSAVFYLIIPWLTNVWVLAACTFMLGLGMGCCQPLAMMMIYDRAPEGQSGEALGLRQTINHFTHMAVPLCFGGLGTFFGVVPVFVVTSLMLGYSGIMTYRK